MKNYQEWYDHTVLIIENKPFLLSILRSFQSVRILVDYAYTFI